MLAYDENGDLREYEEDEGIVICKHCKSSRSTMHRRAGSRISRYS